MARKIKVDVLRAIRSEKDGIVRKGGTANLTGEEFDHYKSIKAVERLEVEEVEQETEEETVDAPTVEGDDA